MNEGPAFRRSLKTLVRRGWEAVVEGDRGSLTVVAKGRLCRHVGCTGRRTASPQAKKRLVLGRKEAIVGILIGESESLDLRYVEVQNILRSDKCLTSIATNHAGSSRPEC